MEVGGIVETFKRCEEMYEIGYDYYIGDDDLKVYKAVCDAKPYGEDFTIEKKNVLAMCKWGWEHVWETWKQVILVKSYQMADLLEEKKKLETQVRYSNCDNESHQTNLWRSDK